MFNFPGERLPVYCQNHKEPNMVDVLNRLCTYPGAHHPYPTSQGTGCTP